MNRYWMIRRLRWPAILILVGVVALLHEAGLVRHFWNFWPLLLILLGTFMLAERAALAADGDPYYPGPYPGTPQPGVGDPLAQAAAAQRATEPGTAIVPANTHDFDDHPNGGSQ